MRATAQKVRRSAALKLAVATAEVLDQVTSGLLLRTGEAGGAPSSGVSRGATEAVYRHHFGHKNRLGHGCYRRNKAQRLQSGAEIARRVFFVLLAVYESVFNYC